MFIKSIIFSFIAIVLFYIANYVMPEITVQTTLNSVNGGTTEAIIRRIGNGAFVIYILGTLFLVMSLFYFLKGLWLMKRSNSISSLFIISCLIASFGCGQYQVPEYITVEHNQTAFVIPLEGDTSKQVKFETVKDLEGYKVSIKRIEIPKRKSSTGRMWFNYEWIPTIKVITVARAPITVKWDSSDGTGGIWVESSDSVGFSTGFSVTAFIDEPDAALFLYKYNGNSLEQVINTELRARIQSGCADFAAKTNMDKLRSLKNEMIASIREEVVPYFKERGISITTIGSFGGFTYENPKIQQAIDMVFVSQQEKEVASALLSAQKDKNERMKQEGEGEASKLMEVAKGKAEAELLEAKGRASAIEMVAKATKEAGSDPLFVQIKTLEVISDQVKKWDGRYPTFMMSGGDGKQSPLLMIQLPSSIVEKQ